MSSIRHECHSHNLRSFLNRIRSFQIISGGSLIFSSHQTNSYGTPICDTNRPLCLPRENEAAIDGKVATNRKKNHMSIDYGQSELAETLFGGAVAREVK